MLQACEIAQRQGVSLRLDLVGPDTTPPLPGFATLHGLLRKSHPGQRRRFEKLLAESDLFFMPSRAENYGIALCEAAAYGIPCLSSAVGGIPTIVQADVSGYALPANSPPEAYAAVIRDCAADLERYRALCHSSRRHYEQQLSWDRFGDSLMRILRGPSHAETEMAAAAG